MSNEVSDGHPSLPAPARPPYSAVQDALCHPSVFWVGLAHGGFTMKYGGNRMGEESGVGVSHEH